MEDLAVRAVLNKMLEIEERISMLNPKTDAELIRELRKQELALQHHFDNLVPA